MRSALWRVRQALPGPDFLLVDEINLGFNPQAPFWLDTVALERASAVAEPVIRAFGVLQTIPSIALLAFMIPLLGIGVWPAVTALFLYSLFPMILAIYAGKLTDRLGFRLGQPPDSAAIGEDAIVVCAAGGGSVLNRPTVLVCVVDEFGP